MSRALAFALVLAGCSRCSSPTFEVRPVQPAAAPPSFPVTLRVVHFGDFGSNTRQQSAVAQAMAEFARANPVDLALCVGDNLRECGPDLTPPGAATCAFAADGSTVVAGYVPPPDPSFREKFEAPLEGLQRDGKPVPVWLVLGNHDVNVSGKCCAGDPVAASRARACLEVAHRSPRWSMPGRRWVLDRGRARFIAIDSDLLTGDYGGFSFDDEVAFVRQAAEACGAKTCFLVAHHPSASAGEHTEDATPAYLARVKRIEEAAGGKIAAWLVGHEHQLEHLRAPAGYDVLISGNTAWGRPGERFERVSAAGAHLLFASTAWGFGILEVGEAGWSYRFVNDKGIPVHCCVASGRGPCEPVTCSSPEQR